MSIKVLFFGMTADIVGDREIELEILPDDSVSTVLDRILTDHPLLSAYELKFAVNEEYSSAFSALREDDELAIFTAVSGG